MMKIGKLPETVLVRSVLKQIKHRRNDVISGPAVGIDCAALKIEDDEILVLSTDPITGTVKDLGSHCIHVTANDIAASGAEPIGVMLTMLLPPSIEEQEIRTIMQDAETACASMDMEILGGHTEITAHVQQPLVTVTGIGKMKESNFLNPENVGPGQDIIVTKWIGLEATTILAKEKEEELLNRFSKGFIADAQQFDQMLSVVAEAKIAMQNGVKLMHDVTEGGIFGAFWEIAEAGHVGLEIDLKKIPIRQETVEICEYFGLNPYQIMSSGSMLMVAENGEALVRALREAGYEAVIVGQTTDGNDRLLLNGVEKRYLDKPQPDELYKAFSN